MKNLGQMMKQAQELQAKMAKAQSELGDIQVEANSGGGMVVEISADPTSGFNQAFKGSGYVGELACFYSVMHACAYIYRFKCVLN